jgi:glycine C-acetyltransferase
MGSKFQEFLAEQITELHNTGLYKDERVISSQQAADIAVQNGDVVINFCANNYLGLANSQELIDAGKSALDKYGYGMLQCDLFAALRLSIKT